MEIAKTLSKTPYLAQKKDPFNVNLIDSIFKINLFLKSNRFLKENTK